MEVNRQYEEDRAILIPLTIVTDFECAKVISKIDRGAKGAND
jgi:hypothetical protein